MEIGIVCGRSILGLLMCECVWCDSEQTQSSESMLVLV